jgi:DNA-binding SARP family transcriptional activator
MASRTRDVTKGGAAIVGLLIIVGGIPGALVVLGEGLPTSLPSGRAVSDWAGRPLTDGALLRAVGLVCWAVWALFVVALVVEIVGQLGHRPTGPGRRRPVRIPGFHRLAGACVLTAMLVLPPRAPTAGHTGLAGRVFPPAPISLSVSHSPSAFEDGLAVFGESGPGSAAGPRRHAAPAAPAAGWAAGWQRYVVHRYDSPWSIAERHLGDGSRWRELRDVHGRSLWRPIHADGNEPHQREDEPRPRRAEGRGEQAGRARIIHPGEVLLIPAAHGRGMGPGLPAWARLGNGGQPLATPPPAVVSPAPAVVSPPPAVVSPPPAVVSPPPAVVTPPPAVVTRPPPDQRRESRPPLATPPPAVVTPQPADQRRESRPPLATPPPPALAAPPIATRPPADQLSQSRPPPSTLAPPVMSALDGGGVPTRAGRRAEVQVGVSLLEAGILSASVFGMLEMLRRRQRQHRPFGRRICLPSGAVAETELALRIGQQPDVAYRIERAVQTLWATTVGSAKPLPAILGAVVDSDGVELSLAEPTAPPPPWQAAAGGFGWRLVDDRVGLSVPSCSEPLPALVPIGKAVASGADVLINLEAAGVLAVTGDRQRASGMIRAMATAMSGLPWAKAVNLILAGFGDELHPAPQSRTVPAVGTVLAELRSTAAVMEELLSRHNCPTIWEARSQGLAGDGWPPTVVLCAEPPVDADLAELLSLAGPGRGIVAVVPTVTGSGVGWTLDADLVPLPVSPLRTAVEPTILSSTELQGVGRLFDVAEDEAGATLEDPPYERLQLSAERPPAGHDAAARPGRQMPAGAASPSVLKGTTNPPSVLPVELALPQPAVLVRVLGPVELEGAGDFRRAKSRELAVYLAMHPHGVGESELDEALWPSERGRVVPPSTRDSTVSVARTALGGPARLLPAQGQGREKRYQIGPEVDSDFGLFCRLHRHGRAAASVDSLRAALRLVRGRPFEAVLSGRNYTWVHIEGHARHIESEVGDAADLAARMLLEAGQPLEARWAARQGLVADPLCERLWIRLMEAADDLGEGQEIERLMDELDTTLELGGDFSGLHPNTLAAYDRYRRGNSRRRGQ